MSDTQKNEINKAIGVTADPLNQVFQNCLCLCTPVVNLVGKKINVNSFPSQCL